MDTEENSAPPPAWMQALENKRKRVHRLAHEIGAGSPCLTCGEGCPGLDLHFWRKLCRNCKCKKEDHDVIDDYGYEQFELLLGASHSKPKRGRTFLNIHDSENGEVEEEQPSAKKVAFDWIPPDVSSDLAAEYMAALPTGKIPISGSDGALYRRQQLERQLPLHDLDAEQCHQLTPAEVDQLKEYLQNLRDNVVGQGRIAKLPMHTSHSADSLRLPSVYNTVPKPFHANHTGTDLSAGSAGETHRPSTVKVSPGISLKPPSAFLPKDRLSPSLREAGRSSPNHEVPTSIVKSSVPADIAHSSVADRGSVFGVTLTPPRSRRSAQPSPTSSLSREASPSYLDRYPAPHVNLHHSTALPHPQQLLTTNTLKPGSYQSPINSRGSSPSRHDRINGSQTRSPSQLPQVGAPHVSLDDAVSLPQGQHSGLLVKTTDRSRDPSPSYLHRSRAPLADVAHSSILPGAQNSSPYSGTPRGPSPAQEYVRHPLQDTTSSLNLLGQYQLPAPQGLNKSAPSTHEYLRQPPQDTSTSMSVPGQYHIPAPQSIDQCTPSTHEYLRQPPHDISTSISVPGQYHIPAPQSIDKSIPSTHEYLRQPPHDTSTSMSVPGQYHIPAPQSIDKSTPSAQEYIQHSPQDITSSLSVPGHYHNAGSPGLENSTNPRAESPRYDPPTNPESFQGEIPGRFNQKPIGVRVLRDHVPKLYASEATPPGGLWVPVDYLEGPKSKPVDGKVLREPVLGYLATSTIVPEALKVLPPSSVEGMYRLGNDSAKSDRHQDQFDPQVQDIYRQLRPSDKSQDQPGTQNLMQSKSAPHSDAMYARITAHSPSEFELDPQDTLSPQVAALSIDIPTDDYPPQVESEPVDNTVDPIPLILSSCVQCQETVLPGEVVVCADRAGPDFVWHPKCFVCDTCGELLVDLVYFYSKGRIFCGRHFADLLQIPRCNACDELIFVREYTVAEGETYHVKHFCCFECDEPLADKQYLPHNDHPVCLDCYEVKYGKKCHTCGLVIKPKEQRMGIQDLSWHHHEDCFRCFSCKKSLIGGRFLLNQDQPFCSKECVMKVKEGRT